MAISARALDRGVYQVIALASNDPTAAGTATDFRITLGETLQFPGGQDEWLVTLADCYFRHPGSTTSVYISTSLTIPRIDGSELTQTLVRVPPSAAGHYYYQVLTTLPVWMPLAQADIRSIEFQLTDDNGNVLPVSPGDVTTATLLIRRA